MVGGDAVRFVVVAPSTTTVGESFRLLVKAEDRWGNPSKSYRGTIEFQGEGIEPPQQQVTLTAEDSGTQWIEGFSVQKAGMLEITSSHGSFEWALRESGNMH